MSRERIDNFSNPLLMKLGISSYTYTWAIGVPGHEPQHTMDENLLLEKTYHHGLSLLQVADNLPLHTMDEERISAFFSRAGEMGIELEMGARMLTEEMLETYLGLSRKCGSRILRFVADGKDYTPSLDEIKGIARNAIPALKDADIILALENHDRILSTEFADIVESVGSEYLGICLDCANSIGAGEGLQEVISTLAPYTVNFHLKEISIARKYHMMGFDIEGRPFGQGVLPLEWALDILTDKCRTAILELWTPPEDIIEETVKKAASWADQSIKYLRPFFDK